MSDSIVIQDGVASLTRHMQKCGTPFTMYVDSFNVHLLEDYYWHLSFSTTSAYAQRMLPRDSNGKQGHRRLHHDVVNVPEGFVIDHINGNGLDNRIANLEVVTQRENILRGQVAKSATGLLGVTLKQDRKGAAKPFGSQAYDPSHSKVYLGKFATRLEAAEEYDAYVLERDGTAVNTNRTRNSVLFDRLVQERLAGIPDRFDPLTAERPERGPTQLEKLGLGHIGDRKREQKRLSTRIRRAAAKSA